MGCCQCDEFGFRTGRTEELAPGRLQSVFCDGSVHWLDNSIQVGTSTAPGYWEMVFLSADALNLPQDVYNNN